MTCVQDKIFGEHQVLHTAADIETVLKGKIKCIVMEYLSAKKKGRSVASPFLLLVQGLGKKYGEGHSFLQTSTERSRFLRRWVVSGDQIGKRKVKRNLETVKPKIRNYYAAIAFGLQNLRNNAGVRREGRVVSVE